MILTTNNIVYYLIERGLITFDSVVDGDFMVVEAARRNNNFKVLRKSGQSYFVKQIQHLEQQAINSLHREAICYQLSQNDPNFISLQSLLPKFFDFDQTRHVLITELLPEWENLSEYHHRLGKFPNEIAVLLGKVLGVYHSQCYTQNLNTQKYIMFPKMVPWILSLHTTNPNHFNSSSRANSQVLNIIKRYPEFQTILNDLHDKWQVNSFLHGDMKWENCIVSTKSKKLSLKIVDWELADFGDSCWDVAAIFQAYISFWILSIQVSKETPTDQLADLAMYPLEEMQPAIKIFWNTYIGTLKINARNSEELLERCIKYAAARMIQTVYEYMYVSTQISANAVYLLQVSLNILKNPSDAIHHLLCMREA